MSEAHVKPIQEHNKVINRTGAIYLIALTTTIFIFAYVQNISILIVSCMITILSYQNLRYKQQLRHSTIQYKEIMYAINNKTITFTRLEERKREL